MHESVLGAQRTPKIPVDAQEPQTKMPTLTAAPVREYDWGGSLEEAGSEPQGAVASCQLFSGETIDLSRQGRVCQGQWRLPAGVCQHVRELPVQVWERVPAT